MQKHILLALSALALSSGCTSTGDLITAVATAPKSPENASADAMEAEHPAPSEIVAKADTQEWVAIAPSDLMVMDLAPDAKGKSRRVIIQLMPAPFSQGWVGNIRKLAEAKFWDSTSINRVQDNYVVQWGDATEKKKLPEGLVSITQDYYVREFTDDMFRIRWFKGEAVAARHEQYPQTTPDIPPAMFSDPYSDGFSFVGGFPVGMNLDYRFGSPAVIFPKTVWPVHCYGMVGVGRNLSPDTGTGAELYTVIGHAPRHLDRNIALVGRVIEGIEHLSSLPRGTGGLGFYESEAERTPIVSVRIGNDASDLPAFEYLSTESESFAAYADARANRRDPFFNVPTGGADICNIPVPVRRRAAPSK